jgi:hypothetical protein
LFPVPSLPPCLSFFPFLPSFLPSSLPTCLLPFPSLPFLCSYFLFLFYMRFGPGIFKLLLRSKKRNTRFSRENQGYTSLGLRVHMYKKSFISLLSLFLWYFWSLHLSEEECH